MGSIKADQDTSFQSIGRIVSEFAAIAQKDPAVQGVIAFSGGGGGTSNTGRMFLILKSQNQRKGVTADDVINRLRAKTARVPGRRCHCNRRRTSASAVAWASALYQYSLQAESIPDLNLWAPKVVAKLRTLPGLADVDSDQQNGGLQASIAIDRPTASRLGITPQMIDDTLYDAFGQRQVSTMFYPLNQYHVIMEAQSQFWQNPEGLKYIYVKSNSGALVPLSAFTHYATTMTPLAINHSAQFPSITISFNLVGTVSLGQAVTEIQDATAAMGLPVTVRGNFSGTAAAYQSQQSNTIMLIIAAIVAVYIVLGILYESFIHPITILSTLPSASVGALLALRVSHTELSIIALIGIILLIGIVKKNAIMMIDFALEAERREGLSPRDAIFKACLLRFAPSP